MDTVDDGAWQARQFELHRAHLQAVAYRMLGSVTEAEDAVQEAWFRLNRSEDGAIENMQAWLTTVVGRICIDMLRSRRTHREDAIGSRLPEPLVDLADLDDRDGPEDQAVLADSVGLALLVVLETLTPAERLAFVLHDMFAVPFEDIAAVLDRTPTAARQLASRARRRVRGATPVPDRDLARQREVASAFLAAARAGDFDALVAVLDPDVVFRVDTGSRVAAGAAVRSGATDVAREFVVQGPRFASLCRLAVVNGAVGIVARTRSGPLAVAGLTVAGGRIAEIDLVLDPEKLRRLVPDEEGPRG
jgi:RNA polymerase sigma factor (sigma-70 family)